MLGAKKPLESDITDLVHHFGIHNTNEGNQSSPRSKNSNRRSTDVINKVTKNSQFSASSSKKHALKYPAYYIAVENFVKYKDFLAFCIDSDNTKLSLIGHEDRNRKVWPPHLG